MSVYKGDTLIAGSGSGSNLFFEGQTSSSAGTYTITKTFTPKLVTKFPIMLKIINY